MSTADNSPEHPIPTPRHRTLAESKAAEYAGGAPRITSEESGLYRLLVDSVQDYAIFALDVGGHILSWNAGAHRLKGYDSHEIIGTHFSVFYQPEDVQRRKPERLLETAIRDGRVEDEGWRVRQDGSRFWADVVITALGSPDGRLVGFGKVTRDLTERRAAQEALRQSEERFRLLVQNVTDYAIFMLDPQGRVASWNEGAERIKGYTSEEIVGRHFSTFYPAADVTAGKTRMELEVAAREGKYEEDGWRVRKDGSSFWASVLITAMRDSAGHLVGFAKVTRDLTERRAAQERAIADARRIAEIETENRTKSEFLAAMSHELRTPINATLGYIELLELGVRAPVTPEQREDLHRMQTNQRHLLRIINDLLNYSRIEAGQVEYEIEPVGLPEVVEAVLPMVEPQALTKGIEMIHGPCPKRVLALTDRGKTEQIVLNLLSNAVKFTPAGGQVTVGCAVRGDRALVSVADTGPGIPQEHQKSIFQPFVQLGRSLTSSHEGTGLGLSISRDLARAMNGDVTVRSRRGAGAVFTLTLPLSSHGS